MIVAASTAMITTTISTSISVKAERRRVERVILRFLTTASSHQGNFVLDGASSRGSTCGIRSRRPLAMPSLQLVRLRFGIGQTAKSRSLHDLGGAKPAPRRRKSTGRAGTPGLTGGDIYTRRLAGLMEESSGLARFGAAIPWDRLKPPSRFSRYR